MKFLVLSDLHGALDVLDKLQDEFNAADAVIFAGDFAKFGDESTGKPALEKLCAAHSRIFSVIGNCDAPSFISEIEAKGISVEGRLVEYEGLCFAGSGGGSKFTGTTLNERSEEDLAGDLTPVTDAAPRDWGNLIVIMHNPPKGCDCDRVAPLVHVGSQALSDFIVKYKPLAVVTGHIHESRAICKIGDTTVINPGALAEGNYARLEVERQGGAWRVTRAELARV